MRVLYGLLVVALVLVQANGAWDQLDRLDSDGDSSESREMLRSISHERRNSQLKMDDSEGGDNSDSSDSYEASKRASAGVPIDQFRQQALDQHNVYRRKHCVPAMTLDPALNSIAQKYADYLAANKVFKHSGNKFNGQWMGENLYMYGGSQAANNKGSTPVTSWYNEIKYYNWNNPTFSAATGHFTQVVWKSSTRLGIGRGISRDGNSMYVVANYFPGGNMQGAFADNVKRPTC